MEFVDKHCFIFEDVEENKLEYTTVHKKFKAMIENQLGNVFSEIQIKDELFYKIMKRGLSDHKKRKIFEQVYVCDNFLVFKKTMIKRNKELDMEALKKIDKASPKEEKILEKINVEQAIAFSKAMNEKIELVKEKKAKEDRKHQEEQEARLRKEDEKLIEVKSLVAADLAEVKGKKVLPPILVKPKYDRPIEELNLEKEKLDKEILDLKEPEHSVENMEERKKRLQEQREMIRKAKESERKKELEVYLDKKDPENKEVTEDEMERRTNIMRKIREEADS